MSETGIAEEVNKNFAGTGQQLEVVNQAIYTIAVGGQEYQIGSRKLTRADLKTLISLRDSLRAEAAAAENSPLFGGTYAADFGYDNRR